MNTYLLKEEKKQINKLLETTKKDLYQPSNEIDNIFTNIIKNNKDANIDDLLNYYLNSLIEKINPLLTNNTTQGLEIGIKNNNYLISAYGGKNINENTFFSFDSISKILTSIIAINNLDLNKTIHDYNNDYNLDATIESILKFTAHIRTKQRIENLSKQETISILKECKQNLLEKDQYKNFYEYNDIGYMILRQIIPNFQEKLDNLLNTIDNNNLTYKNQQPNITGGKIGEENITPDRKGRDIIFPGHTGLYGNIYGLLNLFYQLSHEENILTNEEKNILWKQPYQDPILYKKDGTIIMNKYNQPKYTNKIAGIYKIPNGITNPYNKLHSFDIPNNTTKNAIASSGTCGSWVSSDKLPTGNYTIGILTNPYSYVENKIYENEINELPNTPLKVNQKGIILNYSKELNYYKETLAIYAVVLELINEYIKLNNKIEIKKKLVKKI